MASGAQIDITTDGRQRLYGYNRSGRRLSFKRKKALLAYLVQPIIDDMQAKPINRFSNSGIALAWPAILNRLGYSVDIIDWQDDEFKPQDAYDLVVIHGGRTYNSLKPAITPTTRLVYFSTGSYWKFNNRAEDQRIKDFEKRHGVRAERDRFIFDSEEAVNWAADGIVALGDPSMKDTYPKGFRVFTINNASYPDDHFDKSAKDYSSARNNFLFFAGSGNIHKGLDLLIDSFKDLDQHLYIVTVPDKKVLEVFKQELKLPNIHLVGEVNMRTAEFYEVMDKCGFVILPSCSEGQAGSVVEAMNQGLIPIVSKETRLDTGNFGETFKDNSIVTIKETVRKLSALDTNAVSRMALRARADAIKNHNPEKFRKDLKNAVEKILEKTKS